MKPRKTLWQRLLALALGLACAPLIAEIALRIHNPIPLRLRGTTLVLPTNRHDVLHNPDSKHLDPVVDVVRNELGFRGPPPPTDFERCLSIVAVGGSTTECLHLTEDKTWPHVLGDLLDHELRNVWVNNAGLDGHSTFGHLHLVRQLLVGLRPDYILVFAGINDIDRDDLSEYDQRMLVEHQGPTQWLVCESELLSTVQALVRARRSKDLGVGHEWELDLATAPRGVDDPKLVADYLREQREVLAPRFGERLRLLVRETRAAGIEPVLMTQPWLFMDATDAATGIPLGSLEFGGWTATTREKALDAFNETTRAVARELDVHLVDVARDMPVDSRLYYDWMHYTNAGAKVVAEIVAADLAPFLAKRHPESCIEKP